ncbi:hypothetical protein BBC0178_017920 [Bartonella apihabitans]|uniref:Uncharacterized protein n=1 Tax=Bartonella apihabitans TaxID=2750929 RepID=A0A1U9MD33_9HYPH|nr:MULTISPECIES: hypothetical protein [Bartonella]AQT43243.1 hypothetical protein BBC0178_017920 [Bartonella apihabitans]OLY45828.1 hypothetical protein PEB0150_008120 [Bartonella apis]
MRKLIVLLLSLAMTVPLFGALSAKADVYPVIIIDNGHRHHYDRYHHHYPPHRRYFEHRHFYPAPPPPPPPYYGPHYGPRPWHPHPHWY